ncbi:MAG: hypothetical protein H3C31_07830 [Brumimicrobium sp.]|nr:hypothetical protein [Brumimicrobium sp.]MCO5267988.1 hypothetical protein [Brumimicrobium sp.]
MKLNFKLLSLLLMVFVVVSCSKYEEGGISILTKKARLCKTWKPVRYIYKNGTSTTNVDKGLIELKKDQTANWTIYMGSTPVIATGNWNFINDKAGLNINVTAFGFNLNNDYEIVRLEAKDLRVRDKDGTVICLIPA